MQNQRTYEVENYEQVEPITELRMLRLTPEAVANTWPSLKGKIEMSLPPTTVPSESPDRMTRILESLLSGDLECHVFFKRIQGIVFVYGLCILTKVRNVEGNRDHLLIYAAYGHTKYVTGEKLGECLSLVRQYAKGIGCTAIMAYSSLTSVIETVKRAGGNAEYKLLMLEV